MTLTINAEWVDQHGYVKGTKTLTLLVTKGDIHLFVENTTGKGHRQHLSIKPEDFKRWMQMAEGINND